MEAEQFSTAGVDPVNRTRDGSGTDCTRAVIGSPVGNAGERYVVLHPVIDESDGRGGI